jgi:outer membrane protein assembly factor BamB
MRPLTALGVACVLFLGPARAAEPDPELAHAEKTLLAAGVGTDGTALLDYFRARTLTEADRARLPEAVRHLGDEDFDTREKAVADLLRAGRKALPFLRPAVRDADLERARRAARCVQEIESGADQSLATAAARVLMECRPDGAAVALLAYLPSADDEFVEAAVLRALLVVGVKDGVRRPELATALDDAEPLRRAAAAHVVGRCEPGQRAAVRRLLADADARVRFEAADALVRGGDRDAVPVLIALLGDAPMPLGWRAQDVLQRIAAEASPAVQLEKEDPGKRAEVVSAWRAWWKERGPAIDLAKINLDEGLQGINLLCEVHFEKDTGRVWACRADGKPIWEVKDVGAPSDAQLLPGGRLLVAEYQTLCATERDRTGKVLWKKQFTSYPTTCRRLPNGNTFIATYTELLEVAPDGQTVYSYQNPFKTEIYRAHRLNNGHLLFACGGDRIVELDASGKLVRTVKVPARTAIWAGVEPLPGDRFLVALHDTGRVIEIDADGKILWECKARSATSAVRLPNGNTLITCLNEKTVLEVDRDGKEVWKLTLDGKAFNARRY